MSTLVVVAHPDDETLGCGATIARLVDQGEDVDVLILCETRVPNDHIERACSVLGIRDIAHYDLVDQLLDTYPLSDVCARIEHQLSKTTYDAIYTHHIGDLNLDHAITHRAALTATRPTPECAVRAIYSFETPSSTEWAFGISTPFIPNVYIDVTKTIRQKCEALDIYETEVQPYPHPRSALALLQHSGRRGAEVGFERAEAFMLVRSITPYSRS